jgi:antibiotic biosynthesis monooxygenase (ABM) superfamily enzyme
MYLYNVTVTVDPSIHIEWLRWMKEDHIPKVMSTGYFTENRLCKLLTDESEITYAIQYTFKTTDDLNAYQKEHAPQLQKEHTEKFKDKFAAFRTILEIVS